MASSAVTSFTGFVYFSGDTDIGGNAKSDGSDIRVSLDNGVSFATGQLQYYTVSGGSASGLYAFNYNDSGSGITPRLYYGNPSATNADSTAAWDGNTAIEVGATDITGSLSPSDKTGNNTLSGGSPTLTSGPIGKALSFNGSSDYLLGSGTFNNSSASISCWLRLDADRTYPGPKYLVGCHQDSVGFDKDLGYDTNTYTTFYAYPPGNAPENSAMSTSVWYHLFGVVDASSLKLYVNGALDGNVGSGTSFTGYSGPNMRLGKAMYWTPHPCSISLARFDATPRSADWIALDYAIIHGWSSGSITLGSQQSAGGGTVTCTLEATAKRASCALSASLTNACTLEAKTKKPTCSLSASLTNTCTLEASAKRTSCGLSASLTNACTLQATSKKPTCALSSSLTNPCALQATLKRPACGLSNIPATSNSYYRQLLSA